MACSIINSKSSIGNYNIFAEKTISRLCPFKAGTFKLNGAAISIDKQDSLKTIADKISSKQKTTGIDAKAIDGRLELYSKKHLVQIVDYDSVLKQFYDKKELSSNDQALIKIKRVGADPDDIIIKYKIAKGYSNSRKNIVISGSNSLLLAEINYKNMSSQQKIVSKQYKESSAHELIYPNIIVGSQAKPRDFLVKNLVEAQEELILHNPSIIGDESSSAKPISSEPTFNFQKANMLGRLMHAAKIPLIPSINPTEPMQNILSADKERIFAFTNATMLERLQRGAELPKSLASSSAKPISSEPTFNFQKANMLGRLTQKTKPSTSAKTLASSASKSIKSGQTFEFQDASMLGRLMQKCI
jgi:hypothetical protein